MRSLKESIIGSNNAGITKLTLDMLIDKYFTTKLSNVMDMKKNV